MPALMSPGCHEQIKVKRMCVCVCVYVCVFVCVCVCVCACAREVAFVCTRVRYAIEEVSRLVQRGMVAAACAELTSQEALTLVAVAAKLLPRIGSCRWAEEDTAHAALLGMAAKLEWSVPGGEPDEPLARWSPESHVTLDAWMGAIRSSMKVAPMAMVAAERRVLMTLDRPAR